MQNKAKLTLCLLFLAMIALSVFLYFSRRVYWKYDDQWIIGKREWEIVERVMVNLITKRNPAPERDIIWDKKRIFLKLMVKSCIISFFLITIIELKKS